MKPGRKTKPVEVEIWQGKPGHKTKAELEQRIQADVIQDVAPPEILDDVAVKEWKRVVPFLTKYGILTDLDRNTLALYCQSWADYLNYTEILRESGSTYETALGQIKPRPEVLMRRQAWMEVIRVSTEYGLTPSSRAGMQLSFNQIKKTIREQLDELDGEDFGDV